MLLLIMTDGIYVLSTYTMSWSLIPGIMVTFFIKEALFVANRSKCSHLAFVDSLCKGVIDQQTALHICWIDQDSDSLA